MGLGGAWETWGGGGGRYLVLGGGGVTDNMRATHMLAFLP